MKFRWLLLPLTALALSACDNTTARYSSDYASQLSRNELLVLPAYAEAYTDNADGSQTRMYDYESHVEPILAAELEKKLSEKGYRAKVLRKSDLMNNKTYREYAAFKEAFVAKHKEVYGDRPIIARDKAKNSVITLSGRARALGEKLGAPVFVYVDYNETVRTASGQAVDFAAGVAMQLLIGTSGGTPPDKAATVLAIIDAKNDKVLWMNPGSSTGGGLVAGMVYTNDEQSLKHIQNSITMALHELPDRDKLFEKE